MCKGDQMFQCMVCGSVHFATLEPPAVTVFATQCILMYVVLDTAFAAKWILLCVFNCVASVIYYYFTMQSMISSLSDSYVL